MYRPRINRLHKSRIYYVLRGETQRQRCLSSFELDALMIIKIDIIIYQIISFFKCFWMMPVDTFCFQD